MQSALRQSWNLAIVLSCNRAIRQSCNLAIVQSGNRAIRQSCNPAIVQSGNQPARPASQAGQPSLLAPQPGPAHARHTEAHVGAKNVDFPLVFQAKVVQATGQHGCAMLHRALKETARTPFRQAVWGKNNFSKEGGWGGFRPDLFNVGKIFI